jgi:protoporphyrin/coproporphyrin ferrochelatase
MKRIAVILFNLGGPNNQDAVEPFLFNLFHDPAIIRLKQPWRYLIAKIISMRRTPIARDIYRKIGGGSPILRNTFMQAQALKDNLNSTSEGDFYETFMAMRYWHPFVSDTAKNVERFGPDEIILLPLYPQFSTTTTQSSLDNWQSAAAKIRLNIKTKTICCYPQQTGFVTALTENIEKAYNEASKHGQPRILFSAHGLPEKIAKDGDPYQVHCEMTVAALKEKLGAICSEGKLCYQSRVGPLKWLTPSVESEVRRAGKDKVPLVIVPISFVSDHSETLVELDMEYRDLAIETGVPFFIRAEVVGTMPAFIEGLATMIKRARCSPSECLSQNGARLCTADIKACAFQKGFQK